VHEQLYDAAALILSSKNSEEYHSLSEITNVKRFFVSLASKVAEIAEMGK